jgi:hypothetical protein
MVDPNPIIELICMDTPMAGSTMSAASDRCPRHLSIVGSNIPEF